MRQIAYRCQTLASAGAGGVDCRVRNLSPAGACLEVASQIGIPDDFILVVEIDHLRQPCNVIWCTATRLDFELATWWMRRRVQSRATGGA